MRRATHEYDRLVHERRDWLSYRARAFLWSSVLVGVSILGLVLIYRFGPAPPGARGWHLTIRQFGLLQTLLTTLLSIGAISLLFEYLLRRSWADDLLRFLRLNVVVAKAGVQYVGEDSSVEWQSTLPKAVEIRGLIRDPNKWLMMNLNHLLTACQRHTTTILVGVPDPDGTRFEEVAGSVGLTVEQLQQNIKVTQDSIVTQWRALKPHLNDGSVLRIVTYSQIPMFEVISVDNSTYCLLSRPVDHQLGDRALALEFFQDSPQYPANWLREALRPLENANELLLRDRNSE